MTTIEGEKTGPTVIEPKPAPAPAPKKKKGGFSDWLKETSLQETPWAAHAILATIIVFSITGLVWAYTTTLDEATSGPGRVVPSGTVQVIQNMEGGILAELLVKDGELVDKGQVVARLDETRFVSSLRENRVKFLALSAAEARLRAESDGTALRFPAELAKERPDLVRIETELYNARRRGLEESLAAGKRSLDLAQRELEMTEPVAKRGGVSEVDLLRIRRQVNELAGGIDEKRNKFRSDARTDLSKTLSDLDGLKETSVAAVDRVTRSTLRSPVRGVVKKIYQKTIGAVIAPGGEIIDIVPLEDTLLVEARIKPVDIGFLHVGQSARVKILAFDYSVYGSLPARVEYISADSLDEPKGTAATQDPTYYRVMVRTEKNYLESAKKGQLQIIPGMTATVDVLTGSKTVMTYLLKPFIKVRDSALRER